MDKVDIEKIVDEVMKRIPVSGAVHLADNSRGPLFDTMEEAISSSSAAQKFFQDQGVEKRVK